uniref:Bm170 n=1 Tax=Brugia malayi TaxID=6279 RepID=A0A1I9FZW8_BRUMA|nr:Bm170 [Brugia malayi]
MYVDREREREGGREREREEHYIVLFILSSLFNTILIIFS